VASETKGSATSPPAKARRLLGMGLIAVGAAVLLDAGVVRARGVAWQEVHRHRAPEPSAPGAAVARLRVVRLGLDAIVVEGADRASLRLGPGHLEASPLPGEGGNCVIAGHRDGAFALLRGVRRGDLVEIDTAAGPSRYRVTSIEIVDRDDTRPLASSGEPLLTLLTCYPFGYFGPAPQRLTVRAERVGNLPAAAGAQGSVHATRTGSERPLLETRAGS